MAPAAIALERDYHDASGSYQLPKDGPEHDRLDAQSAALVTLMNHRPFHAPVRRPKRILDIGCGTGVMTNLLATVYPDANVIGLDIATVPDSRHGKRANVEYVQGDIRELVDRDPRFRPESFDYIFQRLLVFGMTDWLRHIASIASLLRRGGWLESQEASLQLYSCEGRRVSDDWWWYSHFRTDAESVGLNVEVSDQLQEIFLDTNLLQSVAKSVYSFSPQARKDVPELAGLEGNLKSLCSLVVKKTSGQRRSEEFVKTMVQDIEAVWHKGFDPADRLRICVVIGQRI